MAIPVRHLVHRRGTPSYDGSDGRKRHSRLKHAGHCCMSKIVKPDPDARAFPSRSPGFAPISRGFVELLIIENDSFGNRRPNVLLRREYIILGTAFGELRSPFGKHLESKAIQRYSTPCTVESLAVPHGDFSLLEIDLAPPERVDFADPSFLCTRKSLLLDTDHGNSSLHMLLEVWPHFRVSRSCHIGWNPGQTTHPGGGVPIGDFVGESRGELKASCSPHLGWYSPRA